MNTLISLCTAFRDLLFIVSVAFLSLLTFSSAAEAALLYKADWENARQIGQVSEDPQSPTTITDFTHIGRTNPPGGVTVVNASNGAVRQGKYAGRIFLGGDEESNSKDTGRNRHRRYD